MSVRKKGKAPKGNESTGKSGARIVGNERGTIKPIKVRDEKEKTRREARAAAQIDCIRYKKEWPWFPLSHYLIEAKLR